MSDTKFDPAKPVMQKNGRPVRDFCRDVEFGLYTYSGYATLSDGSECKCIYTKNGKYYACHDTDQDLINIPEPTLDLTQPYACRDGCKAEVVATDISGDEPLLIVRTFPDGSKSCYSAPLSGIHRGSFTHGRWDIINTPVEPVRHVRWVNFDDDLCGQVRETRTGADASKYNNRIACIRVEFTEGEGL